MNEMVLAIAVLLTVLMTAALYRVIKGPTLFDRMVAVAVIGTKAMILLVVIGFLFERPDMFVDLALAYGLLNFFGAVVLARYFERQNREDES